MHSPVLLVFIVVYIVSLLSVPSTAQFGVAQKRDASKIQALLLQQQQKEDDLVTMLLQVANADKEIMSQEDAIDLAAILKQAAADPETREMISRMETEELKTLTRLKATATVQDVMMELVQVLGGMKMLEIVFGEDQERALRLMQEEGMVDPHRVPLYQQNPALLEEDTRKGLYFTFVTLAVTAGFL